MTYEEFLKFIREHIGNYCRDSYWKNVYEHLKDKSKVGIEKEMAFMAVNAAATDLSSRYG